MTVPTPQPPGRCPLVAEVAQSHPPALVHPGWASRFPWLAQGTTLRGGEGGRFDFGLFGDASSPREVMAAWDRLRREVGLARVVHARQIHEATVREHGPREPGLHLAEACDGHLTRVPGVLLAVTLADCVPVSIVAPEARAVSLLHAGWRGAAAGILEVGLAALSQAVAVGPEAFEVHLGPAICGACYEVGPEVFEGLGLPRPAGPSRLDLRAILAHRAVASGVAPERVSISTHCTRCGDAGLHSHRGGDGERQVGYLGVLA